jgi:hypothetical protein
MKAYAGVEIKLHAFLTPAVYVVSGRLHARVGSSPGGPVARWTCLHALATAEESPLPSARTDSQQRSYEERN